MNHVVEDVGSVGDLAHGAHAPAHAAEAHGEGQQHPIHIYLVIWGLLFFFSICSYLVDYFDLQGTLLMSDLSDNNSGTMTLTFVNQAGGELRRSTGAGTDACWRRPR